MTDSAPIKLTLKAGKGYEDPWLTVEADSPQQLSERLAALASSLPDAANTARLFHGAYTVTAAMPVQASAPTPATVPPAPAPQTWGAPAPQQPAQPQTPQGQQPVTHPAGRQCSTCGQVLVYRTTQSGKAAWRCPDWRWNNGNPNDHEQVWVR